MGSNPTRATAARRTLPLAGCAARILMDRGGAARAVVPAAKGSSSRGRSSAAQSARLSGERSPVRARSSPSFHGGRGVTAASEVVILAVPVRIRSVALPYADAEHPVSSPRCNRGAPRCDGSTPSVRIIARLGMKLSWQSSPLAPGRLRVRLPPSPSTRRLRSVNGKHAPFVRPRCGFDSCRRLLTPSQRR